MFFLQIFLPIKVFKKESHVAKFYLRPSNASAQPISATRTLKQQRRLPLPLPLPNRPLRLRVIMMMIHIMMKCLSVITSSLESQVTTCDHFLCAHCRVCAVQCVRKEECAHCTVQSVRRRVFAVKSVRSAMCALIRISAATPVTYF